MDATVDTASVLTIATGATPMFSGPTIAADTTTRMGIAATPMADIPTTATRPPITTAPLITDGPTTHGPRRLPTGGDGAELRGMATTVPILRRIRCIRVPHSG